MIKAQKPFRFLSFFVTGGIVMKKWLLFVLLLAALPARAFDDPRQEAAAELMRQCEAVLWKEKRTRVPGFDERCDPGHTGLVGMMISPLTTTPGSWHDKRAAAQPEMAGAVAGYLIRAGVKEGNWIGINSTSSYPGFTLSVLCAAKALGLNTLFALSYGSSQWGGNVPEFTVPVMLDVLRGAGLLDARIDLLTPGGIEDRIRKNLLEENALPEVRRLMGDRPETCLVPQGHRASMAARQALFAGRTLKAFVSCGGSWLSMGREMEHAVKLPHGLILPGQVKAPPAVWNRGLIYDHLERGVPCVHLLFTRGVCADWNLPHSSGPEPDFE